MPKKKIEKLALTVVIAWSYALIPFGLLRLLDDPDALLFFFSAGVAISAGCLASAEWNLALGLKRLWWFDWLVCVFMAVVIASFDPHATLLMRFLRLMCILPWLLAGAVVARRGRLGRGAA
jgi:hypothetical protein